MTAYLKLSFPLSNKPRSCALATQGGHLPLEGKNKYGCALIQPIPKRWAPKERA